jgi:ABC-type Zn uptake system ZnuABC Zn-binding protein ZnuA
VIDNAEVGYGWSTFPELLQAAGISWKVYQDVGQGLTAAGSWGWSPEDAYVGNYGDNSLLYFHQYQNALPGDPLYRFARNANIRIVDIEAAVPWSLSTPGVALADAPASNATWGKDADPVEPGVAPYFWLSVSNAIRMADIVAGDLAALFPANAAAIGKNLDTLKRSLLRLRGQYQNLLMETGSDTVYALTGDFVYLTNDMGLLVDGYFIKQDVRWTAADLAGLTKHLRDSHIKVVLHKWMPSEAIQNAVRAGGAKLVVLNAGDPGIVVDGSLAADGLQQLLRSNLEAIQSALRDQK